MRIYTPSLPSPPRLSPSRCRSPLYHPTPAVAKPHRAVTYAKDVAPILQQKCQECHQPGSIAPMSLLTYGDAVDNADAIKDKVVAAPDAAVAHRQDRWHSGSSRTIAASPTSRSRRSCIGSTTARRWAMRRTCRRRAKFADPNRWQLAEKLGAPPDLIIRSTPYTLAAHTQDKWFRPTVETGRDRAALGARDRGQAGACRATARSCTTCSRISLQDEPEVTGLASTAHDHQSNAGLFMEWAVGKTGQIFAEDAGKLMLPGSRIRWEVHMHAIGEEYKDSQVELAVYFYPKGFVPKHRTVLTMFNVARGSELDIPPNEKTITQNFYVLQAPARLENFQPHMHMRGNGDVARGHLSGRPQGSVERRSSNFQWNWHVNYVYADERRAASPERHDARVHRVARQHRREQEQPRSEPVDRLGRPHGRRDGAQLDRRDLPRAGRIRLARRRPQSHGAAEGHSVASRPRADRPRPPPSMELLNDEDVRVLGSLAEKELTTPENYPLSLNALTNACNQLSNRDPVVEYDEATVKAAVDRLRKYSLVRSIQRADARVMKYMHLMGDALDMDRPEIATMCVLMLRGPQTVGEIRTRTARLFDFPSLEDVEATLNALAARTPSPLVTRLERQAGQKEARYAHLLSGEVTATPPATGQAASAVRDDDDVEVDRLGALEGAVELLRSEVMDLRAELVELKRLFE